MSMSQAYYSANFALDERLMMTMKLSNIMPARLFHRPSSPKDKSSRIDSRKQPQQRVKFSQESTLHIYPRSESTADKRRMTFSTDDFDAFTKDATDVANYITKKMNKWGQDLPECLARLQARRNIPPAVIIGVEHLIRGEKERIREARRTHSETVRKEYNRQRQVYSGCPDLADKVASVSRMSSKDASNRAVKRAAFVVNMEC